MSRFSDRIAELKREFQAGQEQVRQLEERKQALQNTLLRISGAIQVLEEMEAESTAENARTE